MFKTRQGKVKRQHTLKLKKVLEPSENDDFVKSIQKNAKSLRGKRTFLICDILINSGMRAEDICKLKVEDTPVVLRGPVVIVEHGKNNKDRSIKISDELAEVIRIYHKKHRPKTLPRQIRRSDNSKPLFYSQSKRPYSTNALYRLVKSAGEKAGISKHISPHTLRHTYCTYALLNGIQLPFLQSQMGHSSIAVTERYLHLVELLSGRIQEVVNAMDHAPKRGRIWV